LAPPNKLIIGYLPYLYYGPTQTENQTMTLARTVSKIDDFLT